MLRGLEGKRALVTGASGGLGGAIATTLHARGMTVVLSGRRADALEALAAEFGERAEVQQADLSKREDAAALAEVARGVDLLVANAGLPGTGTLDDLTQEQIDRVIDVNLRAPVVLARAAAPAMVERGEGHLVFMSSMSGKTTTANQSMYCATKFALRGFALSLRDDLHGTGVGVTTIFPGPVLEAGMFADTGLKAMRRTGASKLSDVTDAVIRGIERDRAEIDVASAQVKLIARFFGMAPAAFNAMGRRMGATEIAAQFVERQRDKR